MPASRRTHVGGSSPSSNAGVVAQLPELKERAQHDAHVRSGRATGCARIVMHADVHEPVSAAASAHQQLGGNQGPLRVQPLADGAGEELERAVDIARRRPESEPDEAEERLVIEAPYPRVLAPDAVATDDAVGPVHGQEPRDLRRVELTVAVHEEHRLTRGRVEPGAERGAVAAIVRMRSRPERVSRMSRQRTRVRPSHRCCRRRRRGSRSPRRQASVKAPRGALARSRRSPPPRCTRAAPR